MERPGSAGTGPVASRRSGAGPSPRVRRNRTITVLVAVVAVIGAGAGLVSCGPGSTTTTTGSGGRAAGSTTTTATPTALFPATGTGAAHLQPGSDPGVLPGPVLFADEGNDRLLIVDPQGRTLWSFPQPGDLPPGVQFKSPDDAFFTPDGKQIIVTEEDFSVVSLIDVATRKIVWRYGTPGVPGAGANHLSNPDDALVLPDGHVLTADIKNCRILLLTPNTQVPPASQVPTRVYGTTTQSCHHDPPVYFGSPNGAFPMTNGHYLVTEINGDWVDEMDLAGTIYGSWHPPGVAYPSDSNEIAPGTYLTVDYSSPGLVETFDRTGRLLWRYAPTGSAALNHPSLALPLPNGDVILNDDHNDRVIVIDPKTDTILWQYGVRGVPGSAPGYLNGVDGLDLAPPHSDLIVHAPTMGLPPAGT